jgi:hypothetical protein
MPGTGLRTDWTKKVDRIENHLDLKGDRIENRLSLKGDRINNWLERKK